MKGKYYRQVWCINISSKIQIFWKDIILKLSDFVYCETQTSYSSSYESYVCFKTKQKEVV